MYNLLSDVIYLVQRNHLLLGAAMGNSLVAAIGVCAAVFGAELRQKICNQLIPTCIRRDHFGRKAGQAAPLRQGSSEIAPTEHKLVLMLRRLLGNPTQIALAASQNRSRQYFWLFIL